MITPRRATADGRYVLGEDGEACYVARWNHGDPRGWRWECSAVHAWIHFPGVYESRFPRLVVDGTIV